MDAMWQCFAVAFICGAVWMWVWVRGREFWSLWRAAWREEARLKREVEKNG